MLGLLSRIQRGQVSFEYRGQIWDFGKPYELHNVDGPPHLLTAHVKVLKEHVWTRLLLHADFGLAGKSFSDQRSSNVSDSRSDSFLLEEIEVDNFKDLFRVSPDTLSKDGD